MTGQYRLSITEDTILPHSLETENLTILVTWEIRS